MYFFDVSIFPVNIIWIGIILLFNIQSIIRMKSIWNKLNLVICLGLLILHVISPNELHNISACLIVDFVGLIISMALCLYINDIETRRKVISEVFETRYKKS